MQERSNLTVNITHNFSHITFYPEAINISWKKKKSEMGVEYHLAVKSLGQRYARERTRTEVHTKFSWS